MLPPFPDEKLVPSLTDPVLKNDVKDTALILIYKPCFRRVVSSTFLRWISSNFGGTFNRHFAFNFTDFWVRFHRYFVALPNTFSRFLRKLSSTLALNFIDYFCILFCRLLHYIFIDFFVTFYHFLRHNLIDFCWHFLQLFAASSRTSAFQFTNFSDKVHRFLHHIFINSWLLIHQIFISYFIKLCKGHFYISFWIQFLHYKL